MCNFLSNVLVSSLSGVGTGVVTSLFVWWLTFKHWSPKLKIGNTISRLPTEENNSKVKYRFKFENIGKRNIRDVEVIVRLRIQGIKKERANNWEVIYLPTSSLEYDRVAIVRPTTSLNRIRPVLEIKTYECDYFQKNFFPEEIKTKSMNNELTLEDAMRLGTRSEFQILISGTDEYSGARRYFESKIFDINDIVYGDFDKNGIEVKSE